MGQYRTSQLIVTKSYIDYAGMIIEMRHIAHAYQPNKRLEIIAFFVVLFVASAVFGILRYTDVCWLSLISFLCIGIGFAPPEMVVIITTDNQKYFISLKDERNKTKALNTILTNLNVVHPR